MSVDPSSDWLESHRGFAKELQQQPFQAYSRLRSAEGPYWDEGLESWFVTSDEQVRRALNDLRFAAVGAVSDTSAPREVHEVDQFFCKWMGFSDADRHDRLRRAVAAALGPHGTAATSGWRPGIEDDLLERVSDARDLHSGVVEPAATSFLATLLGADVPEARDLLAMSRRIMAYLASPTADVALATDLLVVIAALRRLVVHDVVPRRRSLLSSAIADAVAVGAIDEDEAVATVAQIVTGSFFPLVVAIERSLVELARRSSSRVHLGHPPTIEAHDLVLEALRIDPPFHFSPRRLHESVDWMPAATKGQRVALVLASANRDPARWVQPDTFLPGRAGGAGVAFGRGLHHCLGMRLTMSFCTQLLSAPSVEGVVDRIDLERVRESFAFGSWSYEAIPLLPQSIR